MRNSGKIVFLHSSEELEGTRKRIKEGVVCASISLGGVFRGLDICRVAVDSFPDMQECFSTTETVVYGVDVRGSSVCFDEGRLKVFRQYHLDSVIALAEAAASAGVKRFVYLSSTQVSLLGGGDGVSPQTEMNPRHYYAMSKLEGEQALQTVAQITGMDVVIVRAPEVYGDRCDGWVAQIIETLRSGVALPYAGISNQLSLIHEDNLADALMTCALHPDAASGVWTVADAEIVSTPSLLNGIGENIAEYGGLTKRAGWILRFAAMLVGRLPQVKRFLDSSVCDASSIRKTLDWSPPVSFKEGIRRAVEFQKNC